ncbi:hypothetical protein BPAE_0089g00130 [Botrytis paeoniae]|uniref:Uncharacterized protein n=1 Tax=Botrytis paeoniae TaxID=278948 RepID=A0A4Z1FPR8_9HELO|nr:hypothetical protein BPAE_0089g00130 [Botrytis paeoniae]
MGDRALDEYGLPDDNPIARQEAILRRLNTKKDEAEPAKKKAKLNSKRPRQATPSVLGVVDDAFDKLPVELRDTTTKKVFHQVKQVLEARISVITTPTTHTRGESQIPTIVGAKTSTTWVAGVPLSSRSSPDIRGTKTERSPSISEIDSKTFHRSQRQKESPRQRSLSPSNTPPQRHHNQGVKVFVMKMNATHIQRACSDIGKNYGIPGIKTGTVNMHADLIEEWINRRGLGNDPFLIPYGRMVDSNICT